MSPNFSRKASPPFILSVVFLSSLVSMAAQPNYDPPEPSSDFGTPEATAKIAANAGFLDVAEEAIVCVAGGSMALEAAILSKDTVTVFTGAEK